MEPSTNCIPLSTGNNQGLAYYDHIEVHNPLRSKVKKHKLGENVTFLSPKLIHMYSTQLYILGNISPQYLSTLKCIQLDTHVFDTCIQLTYGKTVIHLPHSTICEVPRPCYVPEDLPFVCGTQWQPGGHKCKQKFSFSWLTKLIFYNQSMKPPSFSKIGTLSDIIAFLLQTRHTPDLLPYMMY